MRGILMSWLILAPFLTFILLFIGEAVLPSNTAKFSYHRYDWLLNLIGFIVQGLIIPLCGYLLATQLFPSLWPAGKGLLPFNWWGAFLLNFIVVEFIYYWQHFYSITSPGSGSGIVVIMRLRALIFGQQRAIQFLSISFLFICC
jgi:sterol desaturase/sphingolipid hydroxylase (fatty acid hydroxylase superfamily)